MYIFNKKTHITLFHEEIKDLFSYLHLLAQNVIAGGSRLCACEIPAMTGFSLD